MRKKMLKKACKKKCAKSFFLKKTFAHIFSGFFDKKSNKN